MATLPAQGRITGTVYDSLSTRAPLRGAQIVLIELRRYATSDERGRFVFDSVAEGRYTMSFMHPSLDSLDVYVPPATVELPHSGRVVVTLATPSPVTAYRALCPGPREDDTGVLIGRVRDVDDDTPIAGAFVGTRWTEILISGSGRTDGPRAVVARADSQGVFRLCGMPTRLMLDVRAEHRGFSAGPVRLAIDARLIGHANLALTRADSAANDAEAEARRARAIGSIRGVVQDRSGRAVRDAAVSVLDDPRTARTDARGGFFLDGVPAGTRTVEARKIGAPPSIATLDIRAGTENAVSLTIDRSAQTLAPVTVVGRRVPVSIMERSGFAQRRRTGSGDFFTADDIKRLDSVDLSDVLARMRGMQLSRIGGDFMPTMRAANGTVCIPAFFVDGARFPVDGARAGRTTMAPFTDLTMYVLPNMVRGIEVYSALGSIPPEYDMSAVTACGTVLIWTR